MMWMRGGLWTIFVCFLALAGFRLLYACDVGAPAFLHLGLKYCPAPVNVAALDEAGDRRRELESQIHDGELKIAQAPNCAPPVVTTPVATPAPTPASPPEPKSQSLRIPTELKDLKGCWVSDRGDIELQNAVTKKHTGNARFCYCFGDDGRGTLKYKKLNGLTCEGPITAKLKGGELRIDQPSFDCSDGGLIDRVVTCKPDASGAAVCRDWSRQYPRERGDPEGYHRAEQSQCD